MACPSCGPVNARQRFRHRIITNSAPLPGDYNGNGRVEQADLDLVLMHWGQSFDVLSGTWMNQRPTSGIIDQAEFDAVLLNWNASQDDEAARAAAHRETPPRQSNERTSLDSDRLQEMRQRPARRAGFDSADLAHDLVHDRLGQTAGKQTLRRCG